MSIDSAAGPTEHAGQQAGVRIQAGNDVLDLQLAADDGPLRIARFGPIGAAGEATAGRPAVEVVTVDSGHIPSTRRLVGGLASRGLRYAGHERTRGGTGWITEVRLDDGKGLAAVLRLEVPDGVVAVRATTTVTNHGPRRRTLRSVTSLALRVGLGAHAATAPAELTLSSARSDWVGESRWSTVPLRDHLVDLRIAAHPEGDARSCHVLTSIGTWSTGTALPMGVLAADGGALAWQVEHNGGWRWEVGEDGPGSYLALSGPTETDHQWLLPLEPGASFSTVPATIAAGTDLEGAIAALTAARRATRRPRADDARRPVVFNDYMNTLMGDPTTAKLLPLIDHAAEAGAEIFCIDAGWYDDSGGWWSTVGDWRPSTVRFPDGGLQAVLEHIRDRDMVPGLWLEPEVIGVDSPAATRLPDEAFLQRAGERVAEHGRYHLDLRHRAAIAHLDEVVDRVVGEMGVGFLKLDYNIDPGAGTDLDAPSAGAGLLDHNRAHLAWLDGVLDRYPDLVIENCGSGAMRADFAMLSRLQLQSTTDQQDPEAYPPIAAAAPLLMTPEQAGNWAYPQPEMSDEAIAFTLCTGILGRLYLSGRLDGMSDSQRMLVAEGVAAHKRLRPAIAAGSASWPLGIDLWAAPWVALGVGTDDERFLTLWRRRDAPAVIEVPLPAFAGGDLVVDTVFPRRLEAWATAWDADRGVLTVTATGLEPAARTFRIGRSPAVDAVVVDAAARTGPVHGGATGMLYGLAVPGIPSDTLLAGVRPRTVAQKAPGGLQHPGGDAVETADTFFAAGGDEVLVYLQDALVEWPYEEVGAERYAELVGELATGVSARQDRDRFVFVPFNEGDSIWYADWSRAGRDRFLGDWAAIVRRIRAIHPEARIAGPNESRFRPRRLRDFLVFARDEGVLPDVITWHELQPSSLEHLPAHLARYRAMERDLGIAPRPVNIDEYADRRDTSVPGRMLQWIDLLETGKADGDIAYWTMAGNLDDHAVGAGRANGGWWLLHWYAGLRGETLATAAPGSGVRDGVHALATAEGDAVTVLLGGGRDDIDLTVRGLRTDGPWRARVERVGWSGYEGALAATTTVADRSVTVTAGSVTVRVPNDDPLAAYRLRLAPGVARDVVPVSVAPVVRSAGDAELVDVATVAYDQHPQQYAGTGRSGVAGFSAPTGSVTWTVGVEEAGTVALALLYGTDGVPAAVSLAVDDGPAERLELPATLTRGFVGRVEVRRALGAGEHRVTVRPLEVLDVALDRVELAPVVAVQRFDAVLAHRTGGSLAADGSGVELDGAAAVRFFVGVAGRGTFVLRTSADSAVVTTVHAAAVGSDATVVLPAGITEVRVAAGGDRAVVHSLTVEPAGPAADLEPVDAGGWAATSGAVIVAGDAPYLDLGGGRAERAAAPAGPTLVTLRFSNADRLTGHDYNADVVNRRLLLGFDDGEAQQIAFPFTHDWANLDELSVVVEVPEGAERLVLAAAGPSPRIAAFAAEAAVPR